MQQPKRATQVGSALMLAASVWLFPGTSVATDQSYLNALEAEADSVETTEPATNSTESSTTADIPKNIPKETLTPGMNMGDFQVELQNNFYGSYLFYSKLSDKRKETVYQEYLKNNDVSYLREVIKQELTK